MCNEFCMRVCGKIVKPRRKTTCCGSTHLRDSIGDATICECVFYGPVICRPPPLPPPPPACIYWCQTTEAVTSYHCCCVATRELAMWRLATKPPVKRVDYWYDDTLPVHVWDIWKHCSADERKWRHCIAVVAVAVVTVLWRYLCTEEGDRTNHLQGERWSSRVHQP